MKKLWSFPAWKKFFLLSILFMFLSVDAFANVGKIIAAKGEINILRGGVTLKGKTGTVIEEKDQILTGKKAKMQVMFTDKTIITIGKNSDFKVSEFNFGDKKSSKASFKFGKGAFRTITGKIGKMNPKKFKLKTRTATIGIRGTQLLMQLAEPPKDPDTPEISDKIACTEGKIVVASFSAPDVEVEVSAGQITEVPATGQPTPARAYKPSEIKSMAESSGGGGETVSQDKIIEQENKKDSVEPNKKNSLNGEGTLSSSEGDSEPLSTFVDSEENIPLVDTDNVDNTLQNVDKQVDSAEKKVEDTEQKVKDAKNNNDSTYEVSTVNPSLPEDQNSKYFSYSDSSKFPDSDPYVSWGAWLIEDTNSYVASNVNSFWISGDLTPSSVIPTLPDASYNGDVVGKYTNGDVVEMGSGSFNMNIKFGSASSISGKINFQSASSGLMSGDFKNLNISGSTFATDIEGTNLTGGAKGGFYGPAANSVGGSFNMNSGTKNVTGAFIGKK